MLLPCNLTYVKEVLAAASAAAVLLKFAHAV